MAAFLTQEWMEMARELAQAFPHTPGASVRLQQVVTGMPDGGDVRYFRVIEDGVTLEQALGDLADAEVTLTSSYEDAVKVARRELLIQEGFMSGRVQADGDLGKLMSLLPIATTAEYVAIEEQILERTEF